MPGDPTINNTPLPVPPGTAADRTVPQFVIPTCQVTRKGTGNIIINRRDWPMYKAQGYALCAGHTAEMPSESNGLGDGGPDNGQSEEDGDNGNAGKTPGDQTEQVTTP